MRASREERRVEWFVDWTGHLRAGAQGRRFCMRLPRTQAFLNLQAAASHVKLCYFRQFKKTVSKLSSMAAVQIDSRNSDAGDRSRFPPRGARARPEAATAGSTDHPRFQPFTHHLRRTSRDLLNAAAGPLAWSTALCRASPGSSRPWAARLRCRRIPPTPPFVRRRTREQTAAATAAAAAAAKTTAAWMQPPPSPVPRVPSASCAGAQWRARTRALGSRQRAP